MSLFSSSSSSSTPNTNTNKSLSKEAKRKSESDPSKIKDSFHLRKIALKRQLEQLKWQHDNHKVNSPSSPFDLPDGLDLSWVWRRIVEYKMMYPNDTSCCIGFDDCCFPSELVSLNTSKNPIGIYHLAKFCIEKNLQMKPWIDRHVIFCEKTKCTENQFKLLLPKDNALQGQEKEEYDYIDDAVVLGLDIIRDPDCGCVYQRNELGIRFFYLM